MLEVTSFGDKDVVSRLILRWISKPRNPRNPAIFYDVIGRIGSISTLKVHPRRSPTSAIFTMSVNMKFACLGHRGCLSLSFLASKA